ncbi:uncharacterized protein LOC124492302 [Dermatophagoides farinae]|uniref:uncharacterized protein LOC124492302 n=1 Tax=Dermatophagoides farinae TaxID=6954 RepID=UPI003F608D70
MVQLGEIQIQEQIYPDSDYKHLDIVRINITDADCQRILDLLKQNNVPKPVSGSLNRNKIKENESHSKSKHLGFQPKQESNNLDQPLKKPRLEQKIKQETIECISVNRMPNPKLEPKASNQFAKPVEKFKQISSFLIEPPPNEIVQKLPMAFQVIYGRYKPYKKNKEWTFDGFLTIESNGIKLYKCSGAIESQLDRASEKVPKYFAPGTHLIVGQWECEICSQLSIDELKSGAFFAPDAMID